MFLFNASGAKRIGSHIFRRGPAQFHQTVDLLWYLHLCSVNGITVLVYRDRARALELHEEAHRLCFIAQSVNFPVEIAADIRQ